MDRNIRTRNHALVLASAFLSMACERCAPGQVAFGVSRLTIRNVGAIAEIIKKDTNCGFESEAVKSNGVTTGALGAEGVLTHAVDACVVDIPKDAPIVLEDCNGDQTTATGRVSVTAVRTIGGILTGDPKNPIVPGGPDSVKVEIRQAAFEDFVVKSSKNGKFLTMKTGSVSAKLEPRLAVQAESGACAIATKHVRFSNVVYAPSTVHVTTEERDFDVDVEISSLEAVNGKHGDEENAIRGSMTVWGSAETIPNGDDDDGLDPDYDPASVDSASACEEGIALPMSYACDDVLGPKLAPGAARLTVMMYGRLVRLLDENTECGFSSAVSLAGAEIVGEPGGEGTVTMRADGCTLDFGEDTLIHTECNGLETRMSGRVRMSGVRTVAGRLTGNPQRPIIPITDSPNELQVAIDAFEDFTVMRGDQGLSVSNGKLSGALRARLAADKTQNGVCAFKTPIAKMTGLSYDEPANVTVRSPSGTFQTTIEGAALDAVAGTWGSDSNLLNGTIVVAGKTYSLPASAEDVGLDPSFDQAAFDASWQCGNVELPVRYECGITRTLVQGVAQLTVQTLGKLAQTLDRDTSCGFASRHVGGTPAITGELGRDEGQAVWTVSTPCEIRFPAKTVLDRDCNGKATYAEGTVFLTGTKTVRGILTGDPTQPVIPTSRDPAALRIGARFENFSVWSDPEVQKHVVRSGQLSGVVEARLALDTTTGACSIPTPVAHMTSIAYRDADVVLVNSGMQFAFRVGTSNLEAQAGRKDSVSNRLTGSITVDGESYTIPIAGQPTLDPAYDAAAFERSYMCMPNIRIPANESECSMRQVIGEGVARLLALAVGGVASQVNTNSDCGFNSFWVKMRPSDVHGEPGETGSLEWEIADCEIARSGDLAREPTETDCRRRARFIDGGFRVAAHRTVRGLRETAYWIFDSIVPNTRNSVEVALSEVEFEDFRSYEKDDGMATPLREIRIARGKMSATVQPILGKRKGDEERYDVPTPVARLTHIELRDAPVTISAAGKTFVVRVDSTSLDAFNGSYADLGMTNRLNGTIVIDGREIRIDDVALDPAYDQSDFDARYTCNPELEEHDVVPPASN